MYSKEVNISVNTGTKQSLFLQSAFASGLHLMTSDALNDLPTLSTMEKLNKMKEKDGSFGSRTSLGSEGKAGSSGSGGSSDDVKKGLA